MGDQRLSADRQDLVRSGWMLASTLAAAVVTADPPAPQVDLVSRAGAPADSAGLSSLSADDFGEGLSNSISQDGRYVVFLSGARNVVPGQVENNDQDDCFLFDRLTNRVELVSHAAGSPTTTANQPCALVAISADGSTVAFLSWATNIVSGPGVGPLYLLDRAAAQVTRVPAPSIGPVEVSLSGNGRKVAFRTGSPSEIYFFDRDGTTPTRVGRGGSPRLSRDGAFLAFVEQPSGAIQLWEAASGGLTLVSHAAGSPTTPAKARFPLVADHGAYVAFCSEAPNLVPGQFDDPSSTDWFLFDRASGSIVLASHAANDPQTSTGVGFNACHGALSADGRYLAFTSKAIGLVAGQTDRGGTEDVFLYDRTTNSSILLSHAAGSSTTTGNGLGAFDPAMSADGAYVAFRSDATDLVAGQSDPNDFEVTGHDVFLFQRATGSISLVSHAAGEPTEATNDAVPPTSTAPVAISAEGGHIAFPSASTRLVAGLTSANRRPDIFLYARASGVNVLVSRAQEPSATANGESGTATNPYRMIAGPSVSADGRYSVFLSEATNLVPGQRDANGKNDVFLHDHVSGQTTLVTHAAGSEVTSGNSAWDTELAVISADGRWVVFVSAATNLVPGLVDNNRDFADYYLYDRLTGDIRLVSHVKGAETTTSATGVHPSFAAAVVSDDGGFVAFYMAANLGDGNARVHIFERATGLVTPVDSPFDDTLPELAMSADGSFISFVDHVPDFGYRLGLLERATGATTWIADGYQVSLSADGRFAAFLSIVSDLVPGQVDTPQLSADVFLYHRTTGEIELVSHAYGSNVTAVGGEAAVVSRDGRYVVFTSLGSGLVEDQDDGNVRPDVFLYDRTTREITLVSRLSGTLATAAGGEDPVISGDGGVIAFTSKGSSLFPGQTDSNSDQDVFLFERASGTLSMASRRPGPAGGAGDGESREPVLSESGLYVAFRSDATDLVPHDYNDVSDVFVFGVCASPPVVTQPPTSQVAAVGQTVTFQVVAVNAGRYQWQRDGLDIPGAIDPYYTTPPIVPADSGSTYRARVLGACQSETLSEPATLTIADEEAPRSALVSPSGGEYWLLSPSSGPSNQQVVSWSMSDNVRICKVQVSLRYSTDGGRSYVEADPGGGLPATFGLGGSCAYPGVSASNLTYTIPTSFPSGQPGSLYKVRVRVTDQIGLVSVAESPNPFHLVSANPDSVRTLILANLPRMQALMGVSEEDAAALDLKLQELAANPKVQGVVIDLGGVTDVSELLLAWDADSQDAAKANAVLFGCHPPYPAGCATDRERNGVHDVLRNRLQAFTGVKYAVLVGDDRIIPFARLADQTALLPESAYTESGLDLTPDGTTVGQALSRNFFLSDDPLAVLDKVPLDGLGGALFIPDLSIARLVETPSEITTVITTFIGQDGVLDLTALDPETGHKVLVNGYDFLVDSAAGIRKRWKNALKVATPDGSPAPVDGALIGGGWDDVALRERLAGNGGPRYALMSLNGHATHYAEGAPGADFRFGVDAADLYGPDACLSPTKGALSFSGSVVYAVGCHGGLPVAGSCATDADRSLDLPQTFLARGALAYVANTGYGWGLKHGVGYGERLVELMTRELTKGGTVVVGDAVKRAKQKYVLDTPRPDPYDDKTLMQWTLFGLPMYAVKTGVPTGNALASGDKGLEGVVVTWRAAGPHADAAGAEAQAVGAEEVAPVAPAVTLPPHLTQLSHHFDFTAPGLYVKKDSEGTPIEGEGCPDPSGCYYTFNGLATGSADLPIEPYLIFDSRLSGTSQHGVLWRGGLYDQESGWKPVIAELVSNGGDASNHGNTPRVLRIRPTGPRLVPGQDPELCRPSDTELNSLVVTAGEAVKAQPTDETFTIGRHYREIDVDVFYFNDTADSTHNCDRTRPKLGSGPFGGAYHAAASGVVEWAVPASDPSGVWRVVVVYTNNTVTAGRGRWVPLELAYDESSQLWKGSVGLPALTATYVIQAVDNRGNVTWLDFVGVTLPSSGVPLGVPDPVDVAVPPAEGLSITDFNPRGGGIGTSVLVMGTGFTGASEVTFNGAAAQFVVDSDAAIIALVPEGATSGRVRVTTPRGTATSDASFTVVGGSGENPTVTVNDVTVVEDPLGDSSAIFTVRLDVPAGPVWVSYATSDGTARAGLDYESTEGTLLIPGGSREGYVSVPILGNAHLDSTRHFFLNLTGVVNGTLGRSRGQAWIVDKGPGQRLSFGLTHYSVKEGAVAAVIDVTRAGGTAGTATVDYATSDGSAAAPHDYEPGAGTLIFPPGTSRRTFKVILKNDNLFGGSRTLLLSLKDAAGAALGEVAAAVLTIVDDDAPGTIQLGAKGLTARAGARTVLVPVTRSGGTAGGATVDFATADGTAQAGVDYVPTSGTLTFGARKTKATFPVTLLDDGLTKGDLQLSLVLSNPQGGAVLGAVTTAPLVILSDDPVVQFAAASYTIGENGKTATITVKRGGPTAGALTVDYAAVGGTATSGEDYEPVAGTLTFAVGVKLQSFKVTVKDDPKLEGDETVELALQNPTGGALGLQSRATLTLRTDEPKVQFASAVSSVAETAGKATIVVRRTTPANAAVSVDYATSDGTAVAGEDYLTTTGTLSFPAGAVRKTFAVPLVAGPDAEAGETVNLTLDNPQGAVLGSPATAVLEILDARKAGALRFIAPDFAASEAGPLAALTVTRTGGAAGIVTVRYATSDGTAVAGVSYVARQGVLTLQDGEPAKTLLFTILDDAEDAGNRFFAVTLSDPTGGATLGTPATAAVWTVDRE